jgi:RNA polymerase sigma-70 factor (ECF subfamily)
MNDLETELVTRVKRNRDMMAFRDLVLAHQKRVYCLIRKIVNNHEDSEDLLQEAFIKALKNIGQLKDNAVFGFWLNSIAVNLALAYKRKTTQKSFVSIDGESLPETLSESLTDQKAGERPIENAQGDEIRAQLESALEKLTEKNRVAFVLFYINQMSVREIARTMDCLEVTVRTHVFRAVHSLRHELGDYYKLFKE